MGVNQEKVGYTTVHNFGQIQYFEQNLCMLSPAVTCYYGSECGSWVWLLKSLAGRVKKID